MLIMGCRYSYRGLRAIRNMRRDGTYRRNVLVIGAGEAGNQLIKEINNSRYVKKKVVGVIDDDKTKIGNYIHGAKVIIYQCQYILPVGDQPVVRYQFP